MNRTFWSKDIIFTLLIAAFAGFTHQCFNIVFPVYILDIGQSNAFTGMLMTALTIATLITRLLLSNIYDTWGRKKALILGSTLFMLNTIAYCFVQSREGLLLLRICNGISQGIFFPVPHILIADLSPKEKLASALGYMGIASSIPVAFAPTIGLAVYQTFGANALFILCTITAAIAVLLAFGIKDSYQPVKIKYTIKERLNLKVIIEVAAIAPSVVCLLTYLGYSSVQNFLTPCGLARGISQIGLFFTINTVGAIIARLLAGPLSNRLGIKKVIGGGVILCVAGCVMIAYSYHLAGMLLAAIVLSFGTTFVSQLTEVYAMNHVPDHRKGVANTTWMLFNEAGTGIGSLLWGLTSTATNYTMTFLLSAASIFTSLAVVQFKLKAK